MNSQYKFKDIDVFSVILSIMIIILLQGCIFINRKNVSYLLCEANNKTSYNIIPQSKAIFFNDEIIFQGLFHNSSRSRVYFEFIGRFRKRKTWLRVGLSIEDSTRHFMVILSDDIFLKSNRNISYQTKKKIKIDQPKFISDLLIFEGTLEDKMNYEDFKEYIFNEKLIFSNIKCIGEKGDTLELPPIVFRAVQNCNEVEE